MTRMGRVWVGCLVAVVGAIGVACEDSAVEDVGVAGASGASEAGSGGEGNRSGSGGGGAGAGGETVCHSGFEVLAVQDGDVAEEDPWQIISWPEQHRFGVLGSDGLGIYEVESGGRVKLLEQLKPEDFGPGYELMSSVAAYGSGVVAVVGSTLEQSSTLVLRTKDGAVEELLSEPESYMRLGAAAEGVGIAVSAGTGERAVYLARQQTGQWSWSDPIAEQSRYLSALGIADGALLVGVDEELRLKSGDGAGGAGGEGGAGGSDAGSPNARIELWDLAGKRLQSAELFGNPSVAISTEGGWLIGETNSFWGSYNAAIELVDESGEVDRLTEVDVISAGDGEDGARDLAVLGDRLLVAHCESGLKTAKWPWAAPGELVKVPGPWHQEDDTGVCAVKQIEVVDDVVALGGDGKLFFVRACQ
jgi:hypothetical protein